MEIAVVSLLINITNNCNDLERSYKVIIGYVEGRGDNKPFLFVVKDSHTVPFVHVCKYLHMF